MEFPWYFSKRGLLLFDSFGFAGFKEFIVDKDINIKDKLLFNFKKFNKKDTQINQVLLTFSTEIYKKRKEKKTRKINKHCKSFFSLLSEFGKLKKQNNEMKIIFLDDQFK